MKSTACSAAVVVAKLLDDGHAIDSVATVMLLQLMIDVVLSTTKVNVIYLDMFRRLQLIYSRPLTKEDLGLMHSAHCDVLREEKSNKGTSGMPWGRELLTATKYPVGRPQGFGSVLSGTEFGADREVSPRSPRTIDQRRLRLHENLELAQRQFGLKSAECSSALVKLIEFHIEERENVSIFKFLDQLSSVCCDESIKLSNYQVRAIYAVSSQVRDHAGFLVLVEELERAVFLRRVRTLGFDVNSGAALLRLVWLWQSIGKLEQGRKFCANVLDQASKRLPEQDFTLQYLESVSRAMEKLNACDQSDVHVQAHYPALDRYDHSDEFVSSMAVLALQQFHCQQHEQSVCLLRELTNYYADCVGEASRRVGEMLWLIAATELACVGDFMERLIALSEHKAVDRYLETRLEYHLNAMLTSLIRDNVSA